jgi:hypothetical protein
MSCHRCDCVMCRESRTAPVRLAAMVLWIVLGVLLGNGVIRVGELMYPSAEYNCGQGGAP